MPTGLDQLRYAQDGLYDGGEINCIEKTSYRLIHSTLNKLALACIFHGRHYRPKSLVALSDGWEVLRFSANRKEYRANYISSEWMIAIA